MFEAVAVVLWRCRTRAIISDPDAPAALVFAANARGYVGAEDGYYGKCGTSQLIVAASGAVADGDITDLVKMIQDAKDQIATQFNHPDDVFNVVKMIKRYREEFSGSLGYNTCFVSSWRNLGLEEVDLGRGRPARVVPYKEKVASWLIAS